MSVKSYEKRNKFTLSLLNQAKKQCGINIIDVNHYLLNTKNNTFYANIKNKPLFVDNNHLNIYGANLLSHGFDNIWNSKS
ncbi:SGNH hydrolase domain-containing protein [Photobacterium kishitanii]|uniref:SGNH hydrolase domain-containing protein n=1 Tax=Photobacterium kishitanii TaxID=318456 RepID=UPI003D15FF54